MKAKFLLDLAAVTLLGVAATSVQVQAATVEVPSDKITVSAAMPYVGAGDTILVSNKDHDDPSIPYDDAFTVKSGVRVISKAGQAPIVDGGSNTRAVDFESDASASTLLEGFTLRGGTAEVVLVRGAAVIRDCVVNAAYRSTPKGVRTLWGDSRIEDCAVTITSGTGMDLNFYGVASGGSVDLSGTGTGIYLYSGSYVPSVENVSVAVAGGTGVEVYVRGELHGCNVEVTTGTGIDATGTEPGEHVVIDDCDVLVPEGRGIDAAGYVDISDCTIQVTNGDDDNMGLYHYGQTVSQCFVSVPDATGIWLGAGTLDGCTAYDTAIGVVLAGGWASNCVSAGYSVVGFTGSLTIYDDDNEYCVAPGPAGFDDAGTGSMEVDPLFCDEVNGDLTLRIDSYGNPENNASGELIGAFPVACAWGTLARDASVAAGTAVTVMKDVTIPSGKTLTIAEDVTLNVDAVDDGQSGSDQTLNELIVDDGGILDVNGTNGSLVTFQAASGTAEGTWWGVEVKVGGAATIDYADIRHAEFGIVYGSAETGHVRSSVFASNEDVDIEAGVADGPMDLIIEDNTITVGGGVGVLLSVECDGADVVGNGITGNGSTAAGIEFGYDSDNQAPDLVGNVISDCTNGAGVLITTGADPSLTQNRLQDNKWGIKVTNGTPVIGNASSAADSNSILENTSAGILAEKLAGGGAPVPDPLIRRNKIRSNATGVHVKGGADPDLGTSSNDEGNNTFLGNSYACIYSANKLGVPVVSAQGNYFGTCDGGQPPTCWVGAVDVGNHLCTEPAFRPVGVVQVVNEPLRVLGATPNPLVGSGELRFEVGEAGRVSVQVFDISGGLVRSLGSVDVEPGLNRVVWDGRSEAGRPVHSGMYFVLVATDEGTRSAAKFLVTR